MSTTHDYTSPESLGWGSPTTIFMVSELDILMKSMANLSDVMEDINYHTGANALDSMIRDLQDMQRAVQ